MTESMALLFWGHRKFQGWPFLYFSPEALARKGVKVVKSFVMVSRGKDPFRTTERVLQTFPLPDLKGKNVLIKPNAARLAFPGEGVTTHPSVVAATAMEGELSSSR